MDFKLFTVVAVFCLPAQAATDYEISKPGCIAQSEHVLNGQYIYYFSPTVTYGWSLQALFVARNINETSQDHIDTVIQSKVNRKLIRFAV